VYLLSAFIKGKYHGSNGRSLLLFFLIPFATAYLWNFQILHPSPVVSSLPSFISSLIHLKLSEAETREALQRGIPYLPRILTLKPLNTLLWLRDIILWFATPVMSMHLLYSLIKDKAYDKRKFFMLCSTSSFAVIFITFIVGGEHALNIRYYAMPIIIFYASILYSTFLKSKKLSIRVLTFFLLFFLSFMSFLSPYTHIYYPRHLYDPTIGFKEIGQPSPAYINLKPIIKNYLPQQHGLIMSDYPGLLFVLMDPKDYPSIEKLRLETLSKRDMYIISFIDLRNPLGYTSPEALRKLVEIRAIVELDYCKVFDSGPYTIYYRS
jgi:hypothetical protein